MFASLTRSGQNEKDTEVRLKKQAATLSSAIKEVGVITDGAHTERVFFSLFSPSFFFLFLVSSSSFFSS